MPRRKPEPPKTGRPSKYRPEYATQVRQLCMLGYTDAKLAMFFGVKEITINRWKKDHPEFGDQLRAGKEVPDMQVASALFHRAVGYSHPETDIKVIDGRIVMTDLVKHYPPDTAAIGMWLYNRQPELWKARREEVEASTAAPAQISRIEIEVVAPKPRN